MARNYTTSTTTLWRPESKFTRLTGRQQAVYQMLKGQEQISSAGVVALTYKRWAQSASDYTVDTLRSDLAVLASEGHVVIDEDTEEVLLVKFIRWDKGYGNPKRIGVIQDDAQRVMSPSIRGAIADELDDIGCLPVLAAALRGMPTRESGIAYPASEQGLSRENAKSTGIGVVVTEGDTVALTPKPQTATPVPVAEATPRKRGTRLAEDWRPSDETRAWTLEHIDRETAAIELEKFQHYWIAKTGKDATKLDWDRTWRRWVLSVHAPNGRASPKGSTADTRMADALALSDRLAQQETA